MNSRARCILTDIWVTAAVWIRGPAATTSHFTGVEVRYNHNEIDKRYIFECKERKHTVKYKSWFTRNRVYYSYAVEVVRLDGVEFAGGAIRSYPLLCPENLRSGNYPLLCAISACLHELVAEESN